MSAWYNKFHHTEEEKAGKNVIFRRLGMKTVYKASETKPDYITGRNRRKGEQRLASKNNKHPYILKGRYV